MSRFNNDLKEGEVPFLLFSYQRLLPFTSLGDLFPAMPAL